MKNLNTSQASSGERQRLWWAAKRKNDPAYEMWYSAKKRARRKGFEFSITKDDIKIPELCPILQVPLVVHEGRAQNDSPTLDRVDNSKGYTPDNIKVISNFANKCKSRLTFDEIERLYNYCRTSLVLEQA